MLHCSILIYYHIIANKSNRENYHERLSIGVILAKAQQKAFARVHLPQMTNTHKPPELVDDNKNADCNSISKRRYIVIGQRMELAYDKTFAFEQE